MHKRCETFKTNKMIKKIKIAQHGDRQSWCDNINKNYVLFYVSFKIVIKTQTNS